MLASPHPTQLRGAVALMVRHQHSAIRELELAFRHRFWHISKHRLGYKRIP